MHEDLNLKKLERQIFKTNFQDGIYEMAFALLFLALALNPWLASTGLSKPVTYSLELLLAGMILLMGKRYITLPRQGLVRFNQTRNNLTLGTFMAGVVLNLLVVGILALQSAATLALQAWLIPLTFLLLFSILAYFANFPSLFLVGLLFATSIPISEFLYPFIGEPWDGMLPFGLSALILAGIGTRNLIQFLRKNPFDDPEVSHA